MISLNDIQSGREKRRPRVLLYGIEGIGKSTFAAHAIDPIFIQTEDGLSEIGCDRFPLAHRYEDVLGSLSVLRCEKHRYKTVAIDSLDWLERLIWDRVCADNSVAKIDDITYQKGYSAAITYWQGLLNHLDSLRDDLKMTIILIAHSKIERFEDPELPPFDRYTPRLHKHVNGLVTEWCDAVLFATRKLRIDKEKAGFKERITAKAIGSEAGGDRILRCVGGPACVAKNRYNLPAELPLDWKTFAAHVRASWIVPPACPPAGRQATEATVPPAAITAAPSAVEEDDGLETDIQPPQTEETSDGKS